MDQHVRAAMTDRVEEIRRRVNGTPGTEVSQLAFNYDDMLAVLAALAQAEREREEFRRKYHEAMDILSACDKIDHADAVAQLGVARAEVERLKEQATAAVESHARTSEMLVQAEAALARVRAALETILELSQVDEDMNVTPEWNAAYVEARAALEGRG